MVKRKRTFISFDWALKHLLREKANHDVLEGFISTVLKTDIKIQRLLESEGNKSREDAKYNRVDLLAEDAHGDLLLIEVQGEPEFAYFQRMLFGASKLVTEYIESGENYEHVKRVYSINIVYFDLGQGQDCVYEGKTEFHGLNKGDILQLSPFQKQKFKAEAVSDLYPRYVILKVNDFDRWSRDSLDQWLYFLATTDIPEDADAPGLREAREKLDLMRMSRDEHILYDRYLMDRAILRNQMITALGEGRLEGIEEGLKKGREEGRAEGRAEGHAKGRAEGRAEGLAEGRAEGIEDTKRENARRMKADNMPAELIAKYTGLTVETINSL